MPGVLITRCVCLQTPFADLLTLVRSREWSLQDVVRETGCGNQCGLCLPYLQVMVDSGQTTFRELLLLGEDTSSPPFP